jgi:hypothetical protein
LNISALFAMFIEFSVSNFRSIRDRQTLSLVSANGNDHAEGDLATAADIKGMLHVAAIYGANASGKSNILAALFTLQQLVVQSAQTLNVTESVRLTPFRLDPNTANTPSRFEIMFVASDGVRYEYACLVGHDRVHEEWLVAYPFGRPQRWFERVFDPKTQSYEWHFGTHFKSEKAEQKIWREFTRPDALFLSMATQLNNERVKPVFEWLTQKLIVTTGPVKLNPVLTLELVKSEEHADRATRFFQAADIGIEGVETREEESPPSGLRGPIGFIQFLPNGPSNATVPAKFARILSVHKSSSGEEVQFDFQEESEGTHKLFSILVDCND